jgi:hypothetical protein
MGKVREANRRADAEHTRIWIETGVRNPMMKGEPGATKYAYPNGMLHEQIGRWVVRQWRRLLRRDPAPARRR